jgi:hypothetical protein
MRVLAFTRVTAPLGRTRLRFELGQAPFSGSDLVIMRDKQLRDPFPPHRQHAAVPRAARPRPASDPRRIARA